VPGGGLDREGVHEVQATRDVTVLSERTDEPEQLLAGARLDLEADHSLVSSKLEVRCVRC
jgi:hypothetical protein